MEHALKQRGEITAINSLYSCILLTLCACTCVYILSKAGNILFIQFGFFFWFNFYKLFINKLFCYKTFTLFVTEDQHSFLFFHKHPAWITGSISKSEVCLDHTQKKFFGKVNLPCVLDDSIILLEI